MLRRVAGFGVVCGCGLLLALPAMAQQDKSAPPQQNQTTSNTNQKKDQKKPSTSAQNPFPEAQSQAAAKQTQNQEQNQEQEQQQDQAPAAPAPQGEQKPKSTAAQNPFPEEQSEKAAHQDQGSAPPSSSGKGDFSSSQVKGLDAPGTDTASARTPAPLAYNPKVAKKDVQVGMFYLQTGDAKGAYDRFAEAARSDPGNAEAVYGLGASAQRIGKRDEALRNYRLYLSALPDGPHAKDVRKAMKQMGVEPPA